MSVENTLPGAFDGPGALPPMRAGLSASRLNDGSPGLPIRFSGSGSEYFRLWIVNVLLTLVTIGLYLPWAKVRRLRYFYGNTSIDGHAFDFHGDPKKMLRGMLLVGAMALVYSFAGRFSVTAGLIAFVIFAAIWPALFRTAMRFRLANTSWRGMRFRFTGDLAGAYRAILPLFAVGAAFVGIGLISRPGADGLPPTPAPAIFAVLGLTMLIGLALSPLVFWMMKRYQHGHYALGQVETELRTGPGSFYLLAFKVLGVSILVAIGAMIIVGILGAAGAIFGKATSGGAAFSVAFVVSIFVAYVLMFALMYPYVTSRTQNLVWGTTAGSAIRFESTLRFWPLVGLTIKNILLTVITIGFYWPFARVALTRMRLEAVSVHLAISPDELASTSRSGEDDATGDAAGDFFGFDIGL